MTYFAFPVTLTPDRDDCGFVVTFRDLPEAITQGDSVEQSLSEAADCLEEAIAARIDEGLEIPKPSHSDQDILVPVPLMTAWKAKLYSAIQKSNRTIADLSYQLGMSELKTQQLLDPRAEVDISLIKSTLLHLEEQKPKAVAVVKEPTIGYGQ